jgi:hypothetical protein
MVVPADLTAGRGKCVNDRSPVRGETSPARVSAKQRIDHDSETVRKSAGVGKGSRALPSDPLEQVGRSCTELRP